MIRFKSRLDFLCDDDLKRFIAGYSIAACFSSAAAILYLLILPAEASNALLNGYSLPRLLIIFGALTYGLLHFWLYDFNRKRTSFRSQIIEGLSQCPALLRALGWTAVAVLIFSIYLLIAPASGLRGSYPQVFEKLDPFFLLAGFSALSSLLFSLCLYFQKIEPSWTTSQKFTGLLKKYLIPFGLFVFPFLFFYPRTIPINGEFYIVGNDFIPISYTYKAYLLDFLSHLKFPLWSPSEAAGFPFFSSPFPQPFYPLNLFQAVGYLVNGGYSILDHQRFAVLGVSIFALGTYYWLRQFRFSLPAVTAASLLVPVSFKMVELIRYPIGLHTAAWYPWILLAITLILKSRRLKESFKAGGLLIIFIYCLITGGYLYFVYYSLFLFIPYMIILLVPRLRTVFFPDFHSIPLSRYAILGVSSLAAAVISSPYLLHLVKLISSVSSREGSDYFFSTAHIFNLADTVGSLIFPPTSQTEGWYYFGLGNLLLILIFLGSSLLGFRNRKNRPWYLNPWVKISLVGWFAAITYITYGADSILFRFLWNNLPFFSTLRTWGRLNIVLVPIIALILAASIDFLLTIFHQAPGDKGDNRGFSFRKFILVLTLIYLPLLLNQLYLLKYAVYDSYWKAYYYIFSSQAVYFIYSGIAAYFILLAGGFLFIHKNNKKMLAQIGYLGVFCFSIVLDLWHVGAFNWWAGTIKTGEDVRVIHNIGERIMPGSFLHKRKDVLQPAQVWLSPSFSVGYAIDWYFDSYKDFFLAHEFEKDERSILLARDGLQRIFFSQSIDHQTIAGFLADSSNQAEEYQIDFFDGDRLELTVTAPVSGFVSYIDNWDPYWKASVNGKEAPVEKLFGTFKTVRIDAGKSKVIFWYQPSLFPVLSP
ncbi:MAG: hypothetical protein AB9891_02435 [Anaerolineaceae bacterium]